MFVDAFCTREDGAVRISADQGSRFAKDVAGDHNFIHDPDSRRFCVPGDLLASLVLGHYGLSERMHFGFREMVGADEPLHFPREAQAAFDITDGNGKVVLHVERGGDTLTDAHAVEAFIRRYVAFSGQTFPHYLKPLMAEHGVMFNPQRPLVIYDSMGFDLRTLDIDEPELEFLGGHLEASGKRADVAFEFRIAADGRGVGTGSKRLVMSGLRPYDGERMDAFVETFSRRKAAYEAGGVPDAVQGR
jgi:hypothetical protein